MRPFRSRNLPRLISCLTLSWLVALVTTAAQDPLTYRDRGNRHEGIKSKPVEGYDIELLGAIVEPREVAGELPDKLGVRFFLERQETVYLTVREREAEEFYWLDKVTPTARAPKVTHLFTWSSREVLRPLGLRPSDLVALARLDRDSPGLKERVAPVLFGNTGASSKINAYRFTFKTNASAKTRHRVVAPDSKEVLAPGTEQRRSYGEPFDVLWESDGQPEGIYRLILEGYFLNDNVRFLQEVEFFHAPSWPP